MKRLLPSLLLLCLILGNSCSNDKRQVVYNVRNHQVAVLSLPFVVDDPSQKFHLGKKRSLMIVDGNGFTIPYQRIDSSKVLFMLNVKSGDYKKYTLKSTKLTMQFDTLVRCFTSKNGDVFWENDKVLYRMHSSRVRGSGGGIDYIAKNKGGFISKDSISKFDCYNEGSSLGCGSIAPFDGEHLIRYGNFEKMELLDSGPIFVRMRFTFPEFNYKGKKVHELRTISICKGEIFSKIESEFIGTDSITIALGIPYKDEVGNLSGNEENSNRYYSAKYQSSRGSLCYAENFSRGIGTIYSSVIMGERKSCKRVDADGHALLVYDYTSPQKIVFYQGATTSLAGMNYQMWQNMSENFASQVRSSRTFTSYESE